MTKEGAPYSDEFDPTTRFVRVVERRADGFVEFEFAIGEPELFVEMIMSPDAFAEFCSTNDVTFLDPAAPAGAEDDWDWNLHDAAHRRFK